MPVTGLRSPPQWLRRSRSKLYLVQLWLRNQLATCYRVSADIMHPISVSVQRFHVCNTRGDTCVSCKHVQHEQEKVAGKFSHTFKRRVDLKSVGRKLPSRENKKKSTHWPSEKKPE